MPFRRELGDRGGFMRRMLRRLSTGSPSTFRNVTIRAQDSQESRHRGTFHFLKRTVFPFGFYRRRCIGRGTPAASVPGSLPPGGQSLHGAMRPFACGSVRSHFMREERDRGRRALEIACCARLALRERIPLQEPDSPAATPSVAGSGWPFPSTLGLDWHGTGYPFGAYEWRNRRGKATEIRRSRSSYPGRGERMEKT